MYLCSSVQKLSINFVEVATLGRACKQSLLSLKRNFVTCQGLCQRRRGVLASVDFSPYGRRTSFATTRTLVLQRSLKLCLQIALRAQPKLSEANCHLSLVNCQTKFAGRREKQLPTPMPQTRCASAKRLWGFLLARTRFAKGYASASDEMRFSEKSAATAFLSATSGRNTMR